MLRFRASRLVTILFTSFLFITYFTASLYAQRRDLVVMKNGDQLSGEVKKLENGILYFKPPYVSDSIELDWLQVKSVESSGVYQIVLQNGQHLVGMISTAAGSPENTFELKVDNRTVRVTARDLINMQTEKQ